MSDYEGDEQWTSSSSRQNRTGRERHNTRETRRRKSCLVSRRTLPAPTMVKPKTSSVFEIDVYDTLMREVKHSLRRAPRMTG